MPAPIASAKERRDFKKAQLEMVRAELEANREPSSKERARCCGSRAPISTTPAPIAAVNRPMKRASRPVKTRAAQEEQRAQKFERSAPRGRPRVPRPKASGAVDGSAAGLAMQAQREAMPGVHGQLNGRSIDLKIDTKAIEDQIEMGLHSAGRELAGLADGKHSWRVHSDSDDDDDYYDRGMRLHRRGRFKDAIDAFQKAIDHDQRADAATYNIACDYAQLGDAEHAAEWLKKAADEGFDADGSVRHDDDFDPIRDDPKSRAAVPERRSQRGARNQAEAKAHERRFDRLTKHNPKDSEPWNSIGKELLDVGSYDLADKAFRAAAERANNPGSAALQRGLRALAEGRQGRGARSTSARDRAGLRRSAHDEARRRSRRHPRRRALQGICCSSPGISSSTSTAARSS